MSFMNLSKEQKKYLVLGAIVVTVLAVLVAFGIKVSLSSISEAKLELQGLVEKIEKGEKYLTKSRQEESEFSSTIAELTAHLENIPPDRNYYSWATEIIYAEGRLVRFEIDAIDEVSIAAKKGNSKELDQVKLESYSLRITAHGGYENVKQFLQRIATNYPLVRVTGIEISTGAQPDVHDVQLFIEWPFNLGRITEFWKSAPAQPAETGQPDPKKEPVPPPPRQQATARSVQATPAVPSGSVEPEAPLGESQMEALPGQ